MKNLYKKYQNGDALSDDELNTLLEHFKKTYECVSVLGERFCFASHEAYNVMYTLQGFSDARKEKR